MLARSIAAGAALIGWAALALQLALIVDKLGPALGAWRFLGYFTILTNALAAAVATAIVFGGRGALASPRARLMAATSMIVVGLAYSIALRALRNPTGLQKLADFALHDLTPPLFVLLWLAMPHPRLNWREIGWALIWPAAYLVYALARGAIDGWYAYWFLNPAEQPPAELAVSIAVMLLAFAAIAAALVATDRWLGRHRRDSERRQECRNALIDEAGMESFPASDPPSWTLGNESRS